MTLLRSIAMAFACFSAIPMPRVEWGGRNMRYMMVALPVVGAVVGGLYLLWWRLCDAVGFGQVMRGAGLTLLPLAVTGGIHLDGFADVVDAQSSHAEPARKREILKDPHVGAFAVMGIVCYLLATFACACELSARMVGLLACVPVVSRCLCGLATMTWRASGTGGMLGAVRSSARVGVVCGVLGTVLAAASAGMLVLDARVGAVALAAGGLAYVWTWRLSSRQFGGMSGDIAGFCLQMIELAMLVGLTVGGRVLA